MSPLFEHPSFRYGEIILGIGALLSSIPVLLGSFIFALVFLQGIPSGFTELIRSTAWRQVTVTLIIHLSFASSSVLLAIRNFRCSSVPVSLWLFSATSLAAMCFLAIPSKPGDHFFITYSWPAILATTMMLAMSLVKEAGKLNYRKQNDA